MQITQISSDVDALFDDVAHCIENAKQTQIDYLSNIKPLDFEYELQEWRYRLSGFLECLHAANNLSLKHYERFIVLLFGDTESLKRERSSALKFFNIKVLNKQFVPFNFDVPAINPIDAYYQLTKRIEYRSIEDISRVDVYAGKLTGRTESESPQYTFDQDNLIIP